MSKISISYNDSGLEVKNLKTGKSDPIPFIVGLDNDAAFKAVKRDIDGRENATRGALSFLVQLLDTQRTDGYRGQGQINAEDTRMPKELKEAMRDAENIFFAPFFKAEKTTKNLDTFLSGLREAGVYATVKGVALKYYYFAGHLPCHYEGENPRKDRLLSVSAMQKIMQSMIDDSQSKDESFAARVGTIFAEWTDDHGDMTREELQTLLARLSVFSKDVQEAVNSLDVQATEHASNLTPQTEEMTEEQVIAEIAAHMQAVDAAADAKQEEEAPF